MMFIRKNKGQPLLEYVVLIAVIVAAILVMQFFIKRGYQGRLKSSADEMGEQFSASDTSIRRASNIVGNQTMTTEIATGAEMANFVEGSRDITALGAYSATERTGGITSTTEDVRTSGIKYEDTRWGQLPGEEAQEFEPPED